MHKKGFTLVELLIVIVLIGILTGIALPTYRAYVIRASLTDAFNTLSNYRVQAEQYYQDAGNYGVNACATAFPTTQYFSYSCALGANGQTYVATATGKAANGLAGYTFTIDDANNQVTTAFPNATVPASCWLTQSGGC